MPIYWREQMSVGNLLIDADHRYLICLINMVENALNSSPGESSADEIKQAFNQLTIYAKEHFEREEKIQFKIKYQYYGDHKIRHQKLLEELAGITADIAKIGSPEQIQQKAPEITQLLRNWLLDHVLKEDMKMKKLLESYPPNYIG